MNDYQRNLIKEHKALRSKIKELDSLIVSYYNNNVDNQHTEELIDMRVQFNYMCSYADVLDRRLIRAGVMMYGNKYFEECSDKFVTSTSNICGSDYDKDTKSISISPEPIDSIKSNAK